MRAHARVVALRPFSGLIVCWQRGAESVRPRPQHVGNILAKVFVAHGQPNPVLPMRDGDEAAVRLHNWNALVPHLHTFGIDFAPDVKALVVAGGAWRWQCTRSRRL
jgi:hypothetical protein